MTITTRFNVGDKVRLIESGEVGEIMGVNVFTSAGEVFTSYIVNLPSRSADYYEEELEAINEQAP